MFFKIANSDLVISAENEIAPEKALSSPEITERFKKLAHTIKRVSPRSDEFVYFIARGIHAMEHSAIDPVTRTYNSKLGHIAKNDGQGNCLTCGTTLLRTARGESISGLWCEASEVEPWINQNGDAFPEEELLMEIKDPRDSSKTIKAYQTFVGKGLFTDHKSSEVENIRGIILDAEYDHSTKGVDLLIALDRVNYPELARQVTAGYSQSVSMGTVVAYSLCSLCGNKAVTEMDYCNHVRAGKGLSRAGEKRCYEINNGLSFIELSMVGNGADPRAKIRTIIAQANEVKKNLEANIKSHPDNSENPLILSSISRLESQILDLQENLEKVAEQSKFQEQSFTSEILNKIGNLENQIKEIGGRFMTQKNQEKKAYMQGTEEPTPGKPFQMSDKDYHDYWESDKHLHGKGMDEGKDGLHSGYGLGSDEEVKKMYQRASVEERKQIRKALMDKLAYMQGTEEPTPGKPFEMSDKPYKQYWESDKTMVGKGMEPGKEGLHPGYGMGSDEEVKKELLRAKLRAKLEKAANPAKNRWTVFAGETPVLTLTAEEAYNDSLNDVAGEVDESTTNQEWFDSRNYGINLIQAIKTLGLEKVASQIQKAKTVVAQAAPEAAAPEAMEAPAPAAEEAPAEESQVAESIKAAAERIESAKDEILALTEELTGEEAEAGAELAGDLGAAQAELGELGAEMATPMPAATAKTYNRLVRYALANAEQALENAEAFVESILDTEEAALEVTAAKKKLPEALRKHLEKKKKKDKKAMTEEEINLRKEARHAIAQKLYNLTDGDMIAEAHPEGGNTTTFPGNPEGKIETVKEQQEKDIEVAESMPRGELVARRQTREKLLFAAEKLAQHPAEEAAKKAKDAADAAKKAADAAKAQPAKPAQASSEAVKTAEVDKETKQYYKELASESATGQKPDAEVSKFYNELTQDFGKKKSTAAVHDFALKMKRAYAVSLKRASLGQIESSNEAIEADVDRLVQLDDQSFQALAEVVENTKKVRAELAQAPKQVRTAGALNVGINEAPEMSFTDQLNKLPWR